VETLRSSQGDRAPGRVGALDGFDRALRGALTGIVRLAIIGYNQGDVTRGLGSKAGCS
jgi:hypothetical protein